MNTRKMLSLCMDISTIQADIIDVLLEANNSLVYDLTRNNIKCSDTKIASKVINAYRKYRSISSMKKELAKAASEKDETEKLLEISENSARVILYFTRTFTERGIEIDPKIVRLLNDTKTMASTLHPHENKSIL